MASSPGTLEDINSVLTQTYQMDPPIRKFSKFEVKSAIKNLNTNKSPGYDLITAKVLKELPEIGVTLLTYLFNAIILTGNFPAQWKVAQIKMVLKPGKKPDSVESYRPISLLPITSKLMECLILKRLFPIIEERKIIPNHQFGFRKEHSTIQQVHRIVEYIHNAFEQKKYCTAAFLDIAQAFDRVWHDGLLYKIKITLPINFYILIKSYLNNRNFFVKEGDHLTELCESSAGVPQGSVMGPILYLLYTYDLPETEGVTISTFADDTALLASDTFPQAASSKLQKGLDKINLWLKKWRIKSNETKSVQVTFTLKRDTCPPVKLNDMEIPQSNETKYLGMHLDRKLTWKTHIFSKRKALGIKIRDLHWLLNRHSQVSVESKLLLYSAVLKPVWTYGIQLWGTAANSNIEILQRFQSKTLRMITNSPYYITNSQIHRDLQISTVMQEIEKYARSHNLRLLAHSNSLITEMIANPIAFTRLKRKSTTDLLF